MCNQEQVLQMSQCQTPTDMPVAKHTSMHQLLSDTQYTAIKFHTHRLHNPDKDTQTNSTHQQTTVLSLYNLPSPIPQNQTLPSCHILSSITITYINDSLNRHLRRQIHLLPPQHPPKPFPTSQFRKERGEIHNLPPVMNNL